jgi:hypothetical protein
MEPKHHVITVSLSFFGGNYEMVPLTLPSPLGGEGRVRGISISR